MIYNVTFAEYLDHLYQIFARLNGINITLILKKCYIGFPSVQLLKQRINNLNLITFTDKLKAITEFSFLIILIQLKYYIGLTGYIRKYVFYYIAIIESLEKRKAILN